MTAIVTGANGFIGQNLVLKLQSPICCDTDKTRGRAISPQDINFDKTEISTVYHLGAISSTTETNTVKITNNNILFSCKLLEECIRRDIPFVYASSASVYGMGELGFNENTRMSPLNYYAMSKAAFDMFAIQKIKDNPKARIYGLRYFNVYGKKEDHKTTQASPVHKFIKQANDTKKIKIFQGSTKFLRDFIHINDVVDITLASSKFIEPGIYNVGTGCARSFYDIAKIISTHTGASIQQIPFPHSLKGKYQTYTCSDNFKINSYYKHDRIPLEDGIKKVINGE